MPEHGILGTDLLVICHIRYQRVPFTLMKLLFIIIITIQLNYASMWHLKHQICILSGSSQCISYDGICPRKWTCSLKIQAHYYWKLYCSHYSFQLGNLVILFWQHLSPPIILIWIEYMNMYYGYILKAKLFWPWCPFHKLIFTGKWVQA